MNYDHKIIEPKWQGFWEKNKTFAATDFSKKPKYYALDMFPYPSGAGLHVGHPLGYTATDIICRKRRHDGCEVLHPMGWDAFGLPAENYAVKTGIHPKISTQQNIKTFKRQIQSLGFSYDWDREIDSTDPNYFKWSQWIFLQLFKHGLAYEKKMPMNWCPKCRVVCANEEVENGTHERCGEIVERRNLKQWMLGITKYADRLLEDLDPPKVFLFHGWGGTGREGWFDGVARFAEGSKMPVFTPDFPNTENPKYEEWKEHFEKNFVGEVSTNSIFIAHSLGGGFLQKYLSETDREFEINEIIFVAPTKDDCGIPEIKSFFTKGFDYKKIKTFARKITIIGSDNDEYIPKKDFEFLADKLDAEFQFLPHRGHFKQEGKEAMPEVLSILKGHEKTILDWPKKIRAMQQNWIGKSEGAEIDFAIDRFENEKITAYTTRPDTLFGATYFVLSPENPLLEKIVSADQKKEVEKYIKKSAKKSDMERTELNKEKSGVFTGAYVINPANGEKLPIWIADYVLMSYGTGAIMAVPAHDERDNEFAQKYKILIKKVVQSPKGCKDEIFTGEGISENSDFLNGLKTPEAKRKMIEFLESKKIGRKKTNYKLRDWIFTRQRYWGEPIPLVHCDKCGVVPVDEKDLPLELPETPDYKPSASGESPLAKITDWVNTTCPQCGGQAKRETSTMPNWAGSSWYWLRFMDPKNDKALCDSKKEKYWGPVDLYVGGAEHAVLHLLYGRFWHKFLYDLKLVSTKEPFKKLVNQGLIMAEDGRKMSKSLGNVVNPDDVVEQYGADTLRVYEMFMGPFDQPCAWNTKGVVGCKRFLDKVWNVADFIFVRNKYFGVLRRRFCGFGFGYGFKG